MSTIAEKVGKLIEKLCGKGGKTMAQEAGNVKQSKG
jgi:hypothetical protein